MSNESQNGSAFSAFLRHEAALQRSAPRATLMGGAPDFCSYDLREFLAEQLESMADAADFCGATNPEQFNAAEWEMHDDLIGITREPRAIHLSDRRDS